MAAAAASPSDPLAQADADAPVFASLDPHYLAMLERGVPTMVASCDASLRPSVSLAVGSVFDAAAGELTVFLSRKGAPRVLADIASQGRIAVMCVEPVSHRAVQLKASAVRTRAANAADLPALARYLASVEDELLAVGHPRAFTQCITGQRIDDLVALTFAPEHAFNQAPGPHAGAALRP